MRNYSELIASPGVVLEVGVGGAYSAPNPSMLHSLDGRVPVRRFHGAAQYIGIDQPRDPNWDFFDWMYTTKMPTVPNPHLQPSMFQGLAVAQQAFRSLRSDENISFMAASAHALPMKNETIDEMFFGDVFGAHLSVDARERMLDESSRVLRLGARIVIHETRTPNQSEPTKLDQALFDRGFVITAHEQADTDNYEQLLDIYGAGLGDTFDPRERKFGDPYFMIAQKVLAGVDLSH